jgi:hypothetical protein
VRLGACAGVDREQNETRVFGLPRQKFGRRFFLSVRTPPLSIPAVRSCEISPPLPPPSGPLPPMTPRPNPRPHPPLPYRSLLLPCRRPLTGSMPPPPLRPSPSTSPPYLCRPPPRLPIAAARGRLRVSSGSRCHHECVTTMGGVGRWLLEPHSPVAPPTSVASVFKSAHRPHMPGIRCRCIST